jgi:hypothetical protein
MICIKCKMYISYISNTNKQISKQGSKHPIWEMDIFKMSPPLIEALFHELPMKCPFTNELKHQFHKFNQIQFSYFCRWFTSPKSILGSVWSLNMGLNPQDLELLKWEHDALALLPDYVGRKGPRDGQLFSPGQRSKETLPILGLRLYLGKHQEN